MKQIRSRHSLYLFAITLLLSFFLVAILVCTSLFLFAREKNQQANALSSASVKVVSIADTIKACAPDMQQAKTLLGADKDFYLYYDENWQKSGEPIYCAHIDYTISDHLLTAKIRFYKTDDMESIFQMEIKEFLEVKK